MSTDDSVMHWFEQIQEGDSVAARAVWERYFPKLVQLARDKLRGASRRMADEEDVAASAMESFFRAAQKGRFPDLADRNDLWRLLLQMTARKVVDLKRRETRKHRENLVLRQRERTGKDPFSRFIHICRVGRFLGQRRNGLCLGEGTLDSGSITLKNVASEDQHEVVP